MRLFIAVGLVSCSMLGCGDKGGGSGSASAKADPTVAAAMDLKNKWEETCKGEGDRKEKNKAAKAIIDDATKNAAFKEAYEAAEPSKYGDNYCANMLRASTGAAIEKKLHAK